MGKVLLGMPGPWADDYREPSDPYTTKIGGLPDWPLPIETINADLLRCSSCASNLSLVAQVYAPLSQHRVLFILGCVSPKCQTSWRVLRIQKIAEVDTSHSQVKQAEIQNHNSRDNEDDEGEEEEEEEDEMNFEELGKALFQAGTQASNSKSSKSKKQRRKRHQKRLESSPYPEPTTTTTLVHNHNDVPVVPCFYIYTQEEPSQGDLSSICSNYASLSIRENGSYVEDQSQGEENWEKEHYEYDKALTADRTFLKFKKRLDAFPEQCFRYSHGGKPILAAADEINPGSCRLCGKPRQFEMQLMPPLLYYLQEALDDDQRQMVENWDWMTLIVYTCPQSCCEDIEQAKSIGKGWIVAEESVVAQYEESMSILPGYFS